ncbi:hypothetical protein [Steroidobacter sp.]|uniref:hypothetical protein n=1 Tax=Steroidobacter sp. TaxID=1978227 RepID=UPI0025F239E7|nr:hypothetical protein [Steroidobacter sp.]
MKREFGFTPFNLVAELKNIVTEWRKVVAYDRRMRAEKQRLEDASSEQKASTR